MEGCGRVHARKGRTNKNSARQRPTKKGGCPAEECKAVEGETARQQGMNGRRKTERERRQKRSNSGKNEKGEENEEERMERVEEVQQGMWSGEGARQGKERVRGITYGHLNSAQRAMRISSCAGA